MKKGKILLSGLFTVAAFGLFTSVNAESYVVDSAPDTFVPRASGHFDANIGDTYVNPNNDAVLANDSISSKGQNVIDYHTSDSKKIFCIDRKNPYAPGSTYTKKGEVSDPVLTYIVALSDSFYNRELSSTASNTDTDVQVSMVKNLEQSWLTQIAIWKYQNADSFTSLSITDNAIFEEGGVKSTIRPLDYYTYSRRAGTLWTKADSLIAEAKSASTVTSLTFSFEGNYELDKDAKTVKTGIITSPYAGFSLDLSNAPEGTKVYDKDGNALDSSNITTTEFYLVFPIENVDNYSFDFNVAAATKGTGAYVGYEYTTDAGDYQPMMLITNKGLEGTINFKGSHVDDTASMISRSIYFVGFLILLTGVGMIYVNVKPKKVQE